MIDSVAGARVPALPARILLVGFMASGKSVVGREAARLLDWRFADFDEEIRRETGQRIRDVFARAGEAEFRAVEARVADRLLRRDRVVLASGGGWAAQPGRMEGLDRDTLSVWLKVAAETAMARIRAQGVPRPLLEGRRGVERARRLLGRREPHYRLARLTLDSEEYSVPQLADRIARAARRDAEADLPNSPATHPS